MEFHARIAVMGAGAWGTTIAQRLALKGFHVSLWVYEEELCQVLSKTRENVFFLPGITVHEMVTPTNDMEEAVSKRNVVVFVCPSHVFREVLMKALPFIERGTVVISASKGIEQDTLLTMSGVMREVLPKFLNAEMAVISGPSFAREVAANIPTAITVASDKRDVAERVQQVLYDETLRVYTNEDVLGTELGGALKNVIALGAGALDGLGYGHNTRAALVTRGLTEMMSLGTKMGANLTTFAGLAGLGDLVLTCTSELSRNRTVGFKLGQGMKLEEILGNMRMVAEGIKTAKSAYQLSVREGVEMPITEQVYRVLYEGRNPEDAMKELMTRGLKREWHFLG
jgi:glycerol-3-phosphate dehydrogenase (NAD(P)+)